MRDWALGTNGKWVTMGIPSDGQYGIPKDVMFGFPVTCEGGEYKLVEGLDIGTVVLPDATVKIFLTASPEARATRRWKEYQAKGIDTPYEEVLADVKQRDYQDTHRAAAPLKQAEDAVLLDTSALDFEQSLDAMKQIIAKKIGG